MGCLGAVADKSRVRPGPERKAQALLVDGAGCVTEGASSNVFAVRDGVLETPPLGAGIQPMTWQPPSVIATSSLNGS